MRVYYNDGWGNICHSNDEDSLAEANVICHQLGYTGGSRYWNYEVLIIIHCKSPLFYTIMTSNCMAWMTY